MHQRKLHQWILVAILVVGIIGIVLSGTFLLLRWPALLSAQKERLDNPYINNHYSGWKEVCFFRSHQFSMPGEWRVDLRDDSIYAVIQGNAVIAYVGELGKDSLYTDTSDFCSAVLSCESVVSPYEDAMKGEHFGNGCAAYRITAVDHQQHSEHYYYLFSERRGSKCGIVFCNGVLPSEELLEYVIAVAYSYSFQNP